MATINGIVTLGDTEIPGQADVLLLNAAGTEVVTSTTSDAATGAYAFEGLPGGTTYRVLVLGGGVYRSRAFGPVETDAAGGDPLWGNVVALLPMSGGEGGAVFTDATGLVVDAAGGVYTTEANPPFPGGSSAIFDGVNDSLRLPSSPALDMDTLDFTLEMFVRRTKEKTYGLLDSRGGDAGQKASYLYDYGDNQLHMRLPGILFNAVSIRPVADQWHHVAFVRKGTTMRAFFDGLETSVLTQASVGDPVSFSRAWIGRLNSDGWFFGGQMAQLRITRGVARYTENFDPPTAPFPNF